MRYIFQVAWREWKQYVFTRGYLLGLILVPLFMALGLALPGLLERSQPERNFVLVDPSGAFEGPVVDYLDLQYQEQVLEALRAWTALALDRGKIDDLDEERKQGLSLYREGRGADDEEARRFREAGGLDAALAALEPFLLDDAPAFEPPSRRFYRVALPDGLSPDLPSAELVEALRPYLNDERRIATERGDKKLFAAVFIPPALADYAGEETVPALEYWSTNITDEDLRSMISRAVTEELHQRELQRRGFDAGEVGAVFDLRAPVDMLRPDRTGEESAEVSLRDQVENFVPLGLAYLVWVSIFSMGSILLTNLIEEKSNKIIEVLLSSVTAHELMSGKLLGLAAVGMTTLLFWLGSGVAVIALLAPEGSGLGSAITGLLLSSPLIPAFIGYFILAYLIYAGMYLAVGSMCSSLNDAQTYLSPLMIILLVPAPFIVLVQQDPNGLIAQVMSWIPLYTPFLMMLRLAADPPLWQIIGTTALAVATAAGMLWLMGRVFRQSILRTGQPPQFRELLGLLTRSGD